MSAQNIVRAGGAWLAAALLSCAAPPRPAPTQPHAVVARAPTTPGGDRDGAAPRRAPAGDVAPGDAGVTEAPPGDAGIADPVPGDAGVAEAPPPPLINPVPIEDPSGVALDHFHAALAESARGGDKTRIAFYGASHVASDLFTEVIRQRLQLRFGDGGPGATMPVKPWRWYRHAAFEHLRRRELTPVRVKARRRHADLYGLMGVAFDGSKLRGIGRLRTRPHGDIEGHVDAFELYYLKRPGGGRLKVFIDGEGARLIDTDAKQAGPGYARFEVPEGHHEFELRTLADGPVRLFSLVAERGDGGVVLDTLGVPGARARYHAEWQEPIYSAHLSRRDPDLVVLAYGTNESGDDDLPIETYEARLTRAIERIKSIVPQASCLLVGPSDRPLKVPPEEEGGDRSYAPRPRTALVVDTQRRVSAKLGCGFFDLVAFMGGEMSMLRWVAAEPSLGAPDHIHFTRAGYEALGAQLHEAIVAGYAGPERSAEVSAPSDSPRRP